ncbi:MAG: phosphatidylglycerophosphatase A [Deltaproteobacteria bacterium]|nr:phosphatidylglycerophosphatase A [Deltaproteobacteria bacterium]
MNFKQKSVMFLATGCYIGNISFAPGTFGSVLGLPLCFFLSKIDFSMGVLLTLIFILCAIWVANDAEKILKTKDPGCIVIDEIAGIILTLFGLPFNITLVTLGFLVFRVLDIWKPYPIRLLENKFSGGIGIVIDDVVAGILSNLILRVFIWIAY